MRGRVEESRVHPSDGLEWWWWRSLLPPSLASAPPEVKGKWILVCVCSPLRTENVTFQIKTLELDIINIHHSSDGYRENSPCWRTAVSVWDFNRSMLSRVIRGGYTRNIYMDGFLYFANVSTFLAELLIQVQWLTGKVLMFMSLCLIDLFAGSPRPRQCRLVFTGLLCPWPYGPVTAQKFKPGNWVPANCRQITQTRDLTSTEEISVGGQI